MRISENKLVGEARDLAAKYGKHQVLILMIDKDLNTCETSTYGKTRRLCDEALFLGDACFRAVVDEILKESIKDIKAFGGYKDGAALALLRMETNLLAFQAAKEDVFASTGVSDEDKKELIEINADGLDKLNKSSRGCAPLQVVMVGVEYTLGALKRWRDKGPLHMEE